MNLSVARGIPRIAVGGLHVECSTYNPVPTRAEDFTVLRGAALLDSGYFAFLREYEAAFFPLVHARAIAGGPVARDTYDAFKHEFLAGLRALLPLDGLYLAMHGAMFVAGMQDAEGDWIGAARAVVGPDCLISASYDLHGNVSRPIIAALDMFAAYRTAPHIDVAETMRRAVAMLVRALESGTRPVVVWAPIPVLMPGERSATTDEPARGLYARLPALDARPGIWEAALLVGYVWADEPRATAAAVLTGTDPAALAAAALELAQAYWDAREAFAFGCKTGTICDCVEWALKSDRFPVILADSGDNPTGGGVGDRADVLAALIAAGVTDCIVAGIADAPALAAVMGVGEGGRLTLSIGATLDRRGSLPVVAAVEVVRVDAASRQAVVRIGGILLVISARRRPYHCLADFAGLGLDPAAARLVVVKSGYLSPELAGVAGLNVMALSPGVVDQATTRLARVRKVGAVFPFDTDFAYRPVVVMESVP